MKILENMKLCKLNLLNLKRRAKRTEIEQRINIRQDYEKTYVKNKKRDMDRELEEIKYKNEIANKRNDQLINDINKNTLRLFSGNRNSSNTSEILKKEKTRYEDYTQYQLHSIKKEFFSRIQMKQYEILNLKNTFETQIDKNEEMFRLETLYNERMKKMMKDFSSNMSNLNERNMKIANDREEIIKNYIDLENKTYEAINKIMEENLKTTENKNNSINAQDFEKLVDKCVTHINSKIQREAEPNLEEKDIVDMIDKRLKEENKIRAISREEEGKKRRESKSNEKDNQNILSNRTTNTIESARFNGKMQYIIEEKIRESIGKLNIFLNFR